MNFFKKVKELTNFKTGFSPKCRCKTKMHEVEYDLLIGHKEIYWCPGCGRMMFEENAKSTWLEPLTVKTNLNLAKKIESNNHLKKENILKLLDGIKYKKEEK